MGEWFLTVKRFETDVGDKAQYKSRHNAMGQFITKCQFITKRNDKVIAFFTFLHHYYKMQLNRPSSSTEIVHCSLLTFKFWSLATDIEP